MKAVFRSRARVVAITHVIALFVLLGCQETPSRGSRVLPTEASFFSTEPSELGMITSVVWPEYRSYYYNTGQNHLSARADITNNSGNTRAYDVAFFIEDGNGTKYLMQRRDSIWVASGDVESVELNGTFDQNIVSGWFDAAIWLYDHDTKTVIDIEKKLNAFSAFRVSEGFGNATLNDYLVSSYHISNYDETCGENHPFYYRSDNVEIEQGKLRLSITAEPPGGASPSLYGGECFLDESLLYGQFKATIKMDVSHPYTLGAFWLWDCNDHRSSIVMEIYYRPGDTPHYEANCGTWIVTVANDTLMQNSYVSLSSLLSGFNPNSGYLEYQIDWKKSYVKFYVQGQEVYSITDSRYIPSVPLNLAYSYRMTNWTGGDINCSPTAPPPEEHPIYEVEWACW